MIDNSSKQIVILGMFDVTHLGGAMAVRIDNIYKALHALEPTTLISGNRTPRRLAILKYILQGKLRHTRAIYVEASTSTATEMDILFLLIAHTLNIPIFIFIPDGYQLFPEIFPRIGLKVKLLDWGWKQSIKAYHTVANSLLYPSLTLASYFSHQSNTHNDVLLPAGLPAREKTSLPWNPPEVVYIGTANFRYGSDLLLSAMEQVVAQYPSVQCRFITSKSDFLSNHPVRYASWLKIESHTFDQLPEIMKHATIGVIPLRQNSYNHLAVPVKLFDYMSFGLPMVVTNCDETSKLVRKLNVGVVVEDNVDSLASGILQLLRNPPLAEQLGQNGYQAVQTEHSWSHRAHDLLNMIETIEHEKANAHLSHQ